MSVSARQDLSTLKGRARHTTPTEGAGLVRLSSRMFVFGHRLDRERTPSILAVGFVHAVTYPRFLSPFSGLRPLARALIPGRRSGAAPLLVHDPTRPSAFTAPPDYVVNTH